MESMIPLLIFVELLLSLIQTLAKGFPTGMNVAFYSRAWLNTMEIISATITIPTITIIFHQRWA